MKILIIASLYFPNMIGGAENVVKILAEGLIEKGHNVAVLCLNSEVNKEYTVNGVQVFSLKINNIYWPFSGLVQNGFKKSIWHLNDINNNKYDELIGDIISRFKPDVVNSHNIAGFSCRIWRLVKNNNLPLIHTLHDQYLLCYRTTMFKNNMECKQRCADCRFISGFRLRSINFVDKFIGVSRFILERHNHYIHPNKINGCVVYNPVDVNINEKNIRINNEFKFGFFGKINQSKGVFLLVNAFKIILNNFPSVELHIAGKYSDDVRDKFESIIKDCPSIFYHGFINKSDFFPKIDCLVVPSIWADTAPLVILEAYEFGLPVIGTRMGGIPELVKISGGNISDNDQADLLNKMIASINGSYEFKRDIVAAKIFHVDSFLNKYIDLYRSVIIENIK